MLSTETNEGSAPTTDSGNADQMGESANTRTESSRKSQRTRRGRRNTNNNSNSNRNSSLAESAPSEVKFAGRCEELKGKVCDCSDFSQADGYTKTTKEIAEYVGRVYSADTRTLVEALMLPTFVYPSDPAATATKTEKRKWQKRVDSLVTKEDRFEEDLKKVYSIIWGQCTKFLRAKLEAKDGYSTMKVDYNTIELLKSIKDWVFKFSDQKNVNHVLHEALRKFYLTTQDKNSNVQDYHQ
jgi:hypothetical protein